LGLPLQTEDIMLKDAEIISSLPVTYLKMHQLQVIKNTNLEKEYCGKYKTVKLFSVEEYINTVVSFLEILNPDIAIDRFINEIPPKYLVAPKWGGLRSSDIIKMIENELENRTSQQGKYYKNHK